MRPVSCSLATRCLRQAPTPRACRPRTNAAAIRPLSTGSSEKYSKLRPRERRALEVDPRPQQDVDAFGATLGRDRAGDLLDERDVPRGGQRGLGREAGRRDRVGQAHLVGGAHLAQARRPVRDPDGRDAEPLDRHGRPGVAPDRERRLLLQRQLCEQSLQGVWVSASPESASKKCSLVASSHSSAGPPLVRPALRAEPRHDDRIAAVRLLLHAAGVLPELLQVGRPELLRPDAEVGVELRAHRLDEVELAC